MADGSTVNYSYTLPVFGMDRDTWGDLENANWVKLDADLKAVSDASASGSLTTLINTIRAYLEPVGSLKPWPTVTAPYGWLGCDGQTVNRTDFPDLFALIGTSWGAGDGTASTFSVPNFQTRVPVHRDGVNFGVTGRYGELTHTLTQAEMPVHAHGVNDPQHQHPLPGTLSSGGGAWQVASSGVQRLDQNFATSFAPTGISIQNAGGGGAHNNVQPSVGVLWIIKAINVV